MTEHLKLLMCPYYVADTLFRIVADRHEQVRKANVFYIEYLGMLDHYELLTQQQKASFIMLSKKHRLTAMQQRKDNTVDDVKEMKEIMQELQNDRISEGDFRKQKIEQF